MGTDTSLSRTSRHPRVSRRPSEQRGKDPSSTSKPRRGFSDLRSLVDWSALSTLPFSAQSDTLATSTGTSLGTVTSSLPSLLVCLVLVDWRGESYCVHIITWLFADGMVVGPEKSTLRSRTCKSLYFRIHSLGDNAVTTSRLAGIGVCMYHSSAYGHCLTVYALPHDQQCMRIKCSGKVNEM